MKLRPAQAPAWFTRNAPRAALIFGPDRGQVRELADQIARSVADDLQDPFRVADLAAQTVAADPARLNDEAASVPFGGGRRLVRLRDAGDAHAGPARTALDNPAAEALMLLEAGNLEARSRLRRLFESRDDVAAIACYPDRGADLERIVREGLAAGRVTIEPAAMAELTAHLGPDRLANRSEVEKLALAAGQGGHVGMADVEALLIDGREAALDDVAFATAGGDVGALDRALVRARAEAVAPVAMVRAVQRHFQRLHRVVGAIAGGSAPDAALRSLRPPVFFTRRPAFTAQIRAWPLTRLNAALARLSDIELRCKSTGAPADTVCARMLSDLAIAANRIARRG